MLRRILPVCLILLSIISLAHAEKIKLTDIQLEGNDRVDSATIRAVLTVHSDKEVSLDDIDRDIQAIFKLGYFDDVTADLREEDKTKVLVFVVHERPLVREIRFDGIKKLTDEKLRPLTTIKPPEIYDPVKVKESIAALEDAYHTDGYYAVKVSTQLKTDERNESLLTFKIDEGKKILIDKIVFDGNQMIESDDLVDVMQTKKRWIWSWMTDRGTYKAEQIQIDLERIKALYYDHGYMDVRVKQPQISLIDDGKYMKLLIEIDEGQQYKVGRLRITGDLLKSRKELKDLLTLAEGDTFNRTELRNSVLALTDLYADQGYANVNVVPFTSKNVEEQTIDLKLEIEQGDLIHIEKIRISGNTITRDKVIRRELALVEGDLYSASKIKTSRRKLRNLGFFEDIGISTSAGSQRDLNQLDINVSEKPTGNFTIGAGYSSVDNFITQGSISQANFMGYGIRLNASATIGGASQLYSVSVTDPYFLDTRWSAGFELYKTEREWTDFSEDATGGAVKVGHPIGKYSRGLVLYRYEEKDTYDLTDSAIAAGIQDGPSTLSSVTGILSRNTTDYRLDPSRGGVSSFSAEYAGLGGTDKFAKFELSHRHFFPLFWKTVVSLNGNIKYVVKTTDTEIPDSEKFFLGGLRSIRGFRTREVGPKEGDTFIGGEKAAFFNLEFLFPLSEEYKLKGLFFADTGNAWRESENYFSDMRYSAGYGVRWLSPLGPLRFEWGYNLDPRDGEKSSVFEFSIGSFF